MNSDVQLYLSKSEKWKTELRLLRQIILDLGLTEEYKWRNPCYTNNGKNIVLLSQTNTYCTLSFLKGELLEDKHKLLHKAGPNSRSAKYMTFSSKEEIAELEGVVRAYTKEAIELERNGVKVDYAKSENLELPTELVIEFNEDPLFEAAFKKLTKGRQRGYILYFSAAKQAKTKVTRIQKYKDRIFSGKGMLDCICGLSKRMPNCDGSHKQLTTS